MSEAPRCTPEQAASRLDEGWLYLDVRTPEEFEEGHPPGAYNVPLQLRAAASGLVDNPAFVREVRAWLPGHAKLLLGCRSGVRAERAATALQGLFAELCVVEGSMEGARDAFGQLRVPGWRQAGLPIDYGDARSYAALRARFGG